MARGKESSEQFIKLITVYLLERGPESAGVPQRTTAEPSGSEPEPGPGGKEEKRKGRCS